MAWRVTRVFGPVRLDTLPCTCTRLCTCRYPHLYTCLFTCLCLHEGLRTHLCTSPHTSLHTCPCACLLRSSEAPPRSRSPALDRLRFMQASMVEAAATYRLGIVCRHGCRHDPGHATRRAGVDRACAVYMCHAHISYGMPWESRCHHFFLPAHRPARAGSGGWKAVVPSPSQSFDEGANHFDEPAKVSIRPSALPPARLSVRPMDRPTDRCADGPNDGLSGPAEHLSDRLLVE